MPPYIRPFTSSWLAEDIQFLSFKGVSDVPAPELGYALLESYINWVHPFCALFDIGDFLTVLSSNGAQAQVSLLLFHAVMFAGSAFVDISYLEAAGFESRIGAREYLCMKAKVAYTAVNPSVSLFYSQKHPAFFIK